MGSSVSWLVAGPFVYFAILVFVVATAKKILSIIRMPRHLRWDLYPVAHDGPEGSPYQKVDFWKLPRPYALIAEIEEMACEIMFLKRTFLYNRKIWNFSFPMHFGLYLVIGWIVLVVCGAVVELATGLVVSSLSTLFWAQVLNVITEVVGVLGLLLGLYGTLGLLWMRMTDENLQDYTSPITYFNLLLLLALFGVGLAAFWLVDPSFAVARGYTRSLLTLRPMAIPPLMALEAFLFGVFLIYLPFSRMLHFAAKYFFYHNIMWDDQLVVPGGSLEKEIGGYLNYKMEWGASHMRPHGSWLEQATTNPTQVKKEAPANEKEG